MTISAPPVIAGMRPAARTSERPPGQAVAPSSAAPLSLAERATVLPVLLLLGILSGGLSEARSTATASARAAAESASGRRGSGRNDAIHWAFIVAIFVILALAASLTAAAIIMCARQGGVIDFVVQIDPFRVKVGCKKL